MVIVLMLGWWYSQGWSWIIRSIQNGLASIGSMFAVSILLKTWFSPWKQIYTPTTFQNFLRNAVDNAVSRMIGAVVRGFMLFISLVMAVVVISVGIIGLISWAFLPLLIIILPVLAASGAGV